LHALDPEPGVSLSNRYRVRPALSTTIVPSEVRATAIEVAECDPGCAAVGAAAVPDVVPLLQAAATNSPAPDITPRARAPRARVDREANMDGLLAG
jgi:hypothetical protein